MNPSTDYLRILLDEYYPWHFFALFRAHELYNVEPFLDRLASPILDLGCGDGRIAKLLFKRQLEFGVDQSCAVVDEANRINAYRETFCLDAHHIPLPDESLGGIYSNCVLEHIPDMPALLAEVARLLKPNAYFVTTCMAPAYYSLNPVFRRLDNPLLRPLRSAMIAAENQLHNHVSLFTKEEYQTMLADVGLELEHHQFFAPPNVVDAYGGWETLSKYRLPIPANLSHYGWLNRYLTFQARRLGRAAYIEQQYAQLHDLCYQRPPAVTPTIGAAQILVIRKP